MNTGFSAGSVLIRTPHETSRYGQPDKLIAPQQYVIPDGGRRLVCLLYTDQTTRKSYWIVQVSSLHSDLQDRQKHLDQWGTSTLTPSETLDCVGPFPTISVIEAWSGLTAQPLPANPTDCYRQVIVQLLREQSPPSPRYSKGEPQLVIDQERDHYLLLWVGWNRDETKREYLVLFHLDLLDGKIWVQANATEVLIEQVLVERGVPPEDIVLGCLPTFSRQHSGYGVG